MDGLFTGEALAAFVALTSLEIVLGIDNLVLLTVLSSRLTDEAQRKTARRVGLIIALVARLGLLAAVGWLVTLTEDVFTVLDHGVSVKDILLIVGGAFLVGKATHEIHAATEHHRVELDHAITAGSTFGVVVAQIVALDVVFSFDSVITAVGMTDQIVIMVAAVLIAVTLMLIFVEHVARFVEAHPTVKMLALSYMLMIGVMLVADGFGFHIPHGYVYSAMGFSAFVEGLNYFARSARLKRKASRESKANNATSES